MFNRTQLIAGLALMGAAAIVSASDPKVPDLTNDVLPLLKLHCVRCHGPAKQEGGLTLALPQGIKRGGETGAAVVPGSLDASLLWKRVQSDEMPVDEPLPAEEKLKIQHWIEAGAPGLPESVPVLPDGDEHWAFVQLAPVVVPKVNDSSRIRNDIDRFIQARLESVGLTLSPQASKEILIRRVSFDLSGLPPTIAEIDQFVNDSTDGAYERMVDRYLSSEHYGERWGKYWLDAAGYADSNGYFAADTVRPYAYRYRDYVIRSLNADRPWDQFIREQLAGDELAGYVPGGDIQPEMVEGLEAVHFLRNGPDGTDSSDDNPEELLVDRYSVLEGTAQIIGTSLLGLTVQCARCHDHKFEPFTQKDYYQLQAVLFPALNIDNWITPNKRTISTATKEEHARWNDQLRQIDEQIAAERRSYKQWELEHRERGLVVFSSDFNGNTDRVADDWSNVIPGDQLPAGLPPVNVDDDTIPGAQIIQGSLHILAGKETNDSVLSTREVFDWTPDQLGSWIQATFDLKESGPAARYVGYFIALRDFHNFDQRTSGNVLIDGAASGKAEIHSNYPGVGSRSCGKVGVSGYQPGRNYGIRITNLGERKYELAQIVDGELESGTVTLNEEDLPDGSFGFEYCCGRSYAVDQIIIETSSGTNSGTVDKRAFKEEHDRRRTLHDKTIKNLEAQRPEPIEQLALFSDRSGIAPKVPLLKQGNHLSPGELVMAATPAVLSSQRIPESLETSPVAHGESTGRRLALARWVTRADSRPASLLARVTVNRWWQHHFGTGIVATPENLGYSGTAPTHPDLLDYLALNFIDHGWSAKEIHRQILHSATYRQISIPSTRAREIDSENRLMSHYSLRRMDAEAIRDSMLAVSGGLEFTMYGSPDSVQVAKDSDVIVPESAGGQRRSIYLQQRRTQVVGMLETFDSPSIVFNCTLRNRTTVPLQSLNLLNSGFVRHRAAALANLAGNDPTRNEEARIQFVFRTTLGRRPTKEELAATHEFLKSQPAEYPDRKDALSVAWVDFCQMLLASNAFLYVE